MIEKCMEENVEKRREEMILLETETEGVNDKNREE